MAKRLFILRHAITESNINNIWTGHLDISISPAVDLCKSIQHPTGPNSLDFIISSDANRCRQTLALLDISKTRVIYDPHFIECGYGKYTGLPKRSEVFKRSLYNTPDSSAEFIGESRLTGGLRAFRRYRQLLLEHDMINKSVMIVSHKNTLLGFWALHYSYERCKARGHCADWARAGSALVPPDWLLGEVLAEHPAPEPLENTVSYELFTNGTDET